MVSRSFAKVLCGVLLWTAISFSAKLVDKVVASVNSEPILESDVKMGMLFYGATRREVINKLVENTLFYQFLIDKGIRINQEMVNQVIEDIAKANKMDMEGLSKELAKENLTLEDLRRFIEREMIATDGLMAFLEREIKISDVEIELEKLRAGNVKRIRNIELLVVDKKDENKLKNVFDPKKDLQDIAKEMGLSVERLKVAKGDLIEVLDKEVWQAPIGSIAIGEDKDYIYLAKVLSQEDLYEGKSRDELVKEILGRKISKRKQELLERLKRNSFIKILQ